MSKRPASRKDFPNAADDRANGDHPGETPLTPDHVGEAIGENADPESDVAPNLGGEEQMQDA